LDQTVASGAEEELPKKHCPPRATGSAARVPGIAKKTSSRRRKQHQFWLKKSAQGADLEKTSLKFNGKSLADRWT
jgi:hypothetical protein